MPPTPSLLFLAAVSAAALATAAPSQISMTTTTVPVGQRPDEIALGDVDGDGDLDFVVAVDSPTNGVDVFRNDGSGNFTLATSIQISSQTRSVLLVDTDGDGDLDLVASTSASVAVLTNNGGAFGAPTLYPVQSNPRGLTVADFNGDLAPDLAVANRDSNTVSVLINTGSGAFMAATHLSVGLEPRNVIAADFNRDGDPDLATSNHDSRTVSVLLNLGGGTFGAPATLPVGSSVRPEWVTASDVDGDGDLEIVAALGEVQGRAGVFDNPGNGVFGAVQTVLVNGNEPGTVAMVDLDGDQLADMITGNEDGNNISILANTGAGFGTPLVLPAGAHPDGLAIGDIDRDGDIDAICSNRDTNSVTVLTNQTVGGATRPVVRAGGPLVQGTSVPVELAAPTEAGKLYIAALSIASGPAIVLPDRRQIPLGASDLLSASAARGNTVFIDSVGILGGSGHAFPRLVLPTTPLLSGLALHSAFIVLDANRSLGLGEISSRTTMTIQ